MKLQIKSTSLFHIYFSVLALAVLFAGLRLIEILLHRSSLLREPLLELIGRFAFSFSLDLIVFIVWNSVYVFFYLYCKKFNKDQKFFFRKLCFYFFNLPLIILFFLDMQTLAVQGRLFYVALLSAFKMQMLINAWVFIVDYWYLALIILSVLFIFFRYLPVIDKKPTSKKVIFPAVCINGFFVFLFLVILVEFKNLPFKSEYQYNGVFSRLVNVAHDSLNRCETRFFSDREVLNNLKRKRSDVFVEQQNPEFENVILFVVEGLSLKYVRFSHMPFLADLSNKGIFFKNHFTPEPITILSIVSLLSGVNPVLLSGNSSFPKMRKILQSLKGRSFFTDFNNSRYTTSFFFGDSRKVLGFAGFVDGLGIRNYFFREDYLKETGSKADLDKEGNVFEKPFLRFTAEKIKNQTTPFFSIILTNQIHYPFFCSPDIKVSNSVEQRTEICLKYLDSAIKGFFQEIQNSSWFKRTLFVWTADHPNTLDFTDKDLSKKHFYFFSHNVPLIFYHPGKNLKAYQSNQFSSHTDIIPSLMDYLSVPRRDSSMTYNSIFQKEDKRRFFTKKGEVFYLMGEKYLTLFNCLDKNAKTYHWDNQEWKKAGHKTQAEYDKLIKSYIQYEYHLNSE